jgi:hypothetical protein
LHARKEMMLALSARQELMLAFSIRIRNWCVRWAYESGTDACTEHALRVRYYMHRVHSFNECEAYASGTDAYPEHTGQELTVPWASVSVSYTYDQHKHKNSKFEEVPSKKAEHARKKLMRALSVRLAPTKIKVTS